MNLFDDGPGRGHDRGHFKINEEFAASYQERKKAEELSQLKEKYGSDYEEESETDYSSEDEDAELDTPAIDVAILQTMAKIRDKDPSIYDPSNNLFDQVASSATTKKRSKSKPLKLKDVDRMALLGQIKESVPTRTPVEEAAALKAETVAAFHAAQESSDDEFLTLRDSDKAPATTQDYKQFLIDNVGEKVLKKVLSLKKADPSIAKEDDAFLRDYILNRGWMDTDHLRLPTQAEVVAEEPVEPEISGGNEIPVGHVSRPAWTALPEVDDDEDEEFVEKAEEFETKYNFRFEEAGGTDLVTHSRGNDASLRRPDTSRKDARRAREERKAAEKAEKEAELARMRSLKKEAIMSKMELIKAAAGNVNESALEAMDLTGDFDEKRYAKEMARVFDQDWYAEAEDVDKPTWNDDIDILDLVPQEGQDDDEAYDPSAPVAKPKKKKGKKDKKGKGKAEDEDEGSDIQVEADLVEHVAADLDEYYNMDHEDMIGDLPTRFKYTQVPKVDLGLTPADILRLTDRELNSYVSIKKLAPYRTDLDDSLKKSKRKKLKELKAALRSRSWGEHLPSGSQTGEVDLERYSKKRKAEEAGLAPSPRAPGNGPQKKHKRAGKKERQRAKADAEAGGPSGSGDAEGS